MVRRNIYNATALLSTALTRSTVLERTITLQEGSELGTLARKKRKLSEAGLRASATALISPENECLNETQSVHSTSFAPHCPPDIYFDSTEAKNLFRPKPGETTRQSIVKQIEILAAVNRTDTSYLDVIATNGEVDDLILTNYQKHAVRQKCQLLCMALNLANEKMNKWSWKQCCGGAIKAGKRMGVDATKNPETLMRWYRHFRVSRCLIHANITYLRF